MRALMAVIILGGCGHGSPQTQAIPGDKTPAITVEVLNASGRPGNARVGTRLLREAGIDVVYFGNAVGPDNALDSTRLIVRRGDRKVAEQVRAALGMGRILVEPDTTKLLDVSVLLGADFPPRARAALDFHP